MIPRFFSLAAAYLLWQLAEQQPEWVGPVQPAGLVAVFGVSWLFALRWGTPRRRRPWEAGPAAFFLLPLACHWAWLAWFGGVRLWQDLEPPALLAAWIGVLPFLLLQVGFRYGEARLLGLPAPGAWRFSARHAGAVTALPVLLGVIAQGWESGAALLPAEQSSWSAAQRGFALALDWIWPLSMLLLASRFLPRLFGAGAASPALQELARRSWSGPGPVPRVLHWDTQGLLANAMALGFGPWRRVLVSDALQQKLGGDELLGVLAHELAHLRRRHGLTLVAGFSGGLLAGSVLFERWLGPEFELTVFGALGAVLCGVLPVLLGVRFFEMEADVDAALQSPAHAGGLLAALRVLGRRGFGGGFRHYPISRRLAEVAWSSAEPARAALWRSRARRVRLALWGLFLAGLAGVVLTS